MKTVEIRNVPDGVYRALCHRAAAAGLSLSDFALRELTVAAQTPTIAEVLERAGGRAACGVTTADAVAAVRSGRDAAKMFVS